MRNFSATTGSFYPFFILNDGSHPGELMNDPSLVSSWQPHTLLLHFWHLFSSFERWKKDVKTSRKRWNLHQNLLYYYLMMPHIKTSRMKHHSLHPDDHMPRKHQHDAFSSYFCSCFQNGKTRTFFGFLRFSHLRAGTKRQKKVQCILLLTANS